MAAEKSNLVYDGLNSFELGINSGADPFILPPNQLAFSVNATVRGNFVTNRPPYQILGLTFGGDIQSAVEGGLFQDAIYYRPDTGPEMLVAQIGGRLFTFTPSTSTYMASAAEVSIPGDFNSASLPQAWMTQAERWVIVDNGLDIPIFFDGVSSRRSEVESVVQGVFDGASLTFTPPPVGGTIDVTLTGNYTGLVNTALQLVEYDADGNVTHTSTYMVTAIGGMLSTNTLVLKNLGDAPGASQGANSDIISQPANLGNIVTENLTTNFNGTTYKSIKLVLTMSYGVPTYAVIGSTVAINGNASWKITDFQNGRTQMTLKAADSTIQPVAPNVGDNVILQNYNQPNVTVGKVKTTFTAPADNANVSVAIVNEYTNGNGLIVFINNKQYQVVSSTSVPNLDPVVTLQNLNDTRGNATTPAPVTPTPAAMKLFNFPELPAGRVLTYGMGRVWQSLTDGISFIAGDIVGGSSGSPTYNFRDSVLKVTENSYLANGGSFSVPSNLGNITAMRFTSNLDTSLGQGNLMVVTPGGIFSCNTPVDRTTWASLTNPILTESLIGLGGLGQGSTIVVNGDIIFRAVDGIRSLILARREFTSWGNTPISFEMKRVLDRDNPQGLPYSSAVQFDNRMQMTSSSVQGPQGVYHQGLIALNFDTISGIQGKSASVYDSLWTGLNVLKIIEGQFNGVHRCFAFTYSAVESKIQLYELLKQGDLHLDNGSTPITWSFETPVLFKDVKGKGVFDLCSLEDGEFYVKDILPGELVNFKVEYRPDFSTCWFPWHEFQFCNSSTSTQPAYGARLGLGKPTSGMGTGSNTTSSNFGRWFQMRFTISGHCVFMGMKLSASLQPQTQYARPITVKPDVSPCAVDNL